jgi:hypothetical protein
VRVRQAAVMWGTTAGRVYWEALTRRAVSQQVATTIQEAAAAMTRSLLPKAEG